MFDFIGPGGDSTAVRSRIKIVGANATLDGAGISADGVAAVTGAPLTLACWVNGDGRIQTQCPDRTKMGIRVVFFQLFLASEI
jgi:hypothetical protein